jgi:hypothetical protein
MVDLVHQYGTERVFGQPCHATATFSRCGVYRYRLTRTWDTSPASGPRVLWLMLNPSTADAMKLDPTIRRCAGYSMAWGFGSLEVVNLFAFRATDPRDMERDLLPIGERDEHDQEVNDRQIIAAADSARLIVCGWGAHRMVAKRAKEVVGLLVGRGHRLACLAWSKERHPVHPLYQPKNLRPRLFASPTIGDAVREGEFLVTPRATPEHLAPHAGLVGLPAPGAV